MCVDREPIVYGAGNRPLWINYLAARGDVCYVLSKGRGERRRMRRKTPGR
jgi:hypothetical protein